MPADAAVVTYWLGDTRSWAWTVTRGGVELHALPSRATIDAAVSRLLQRVRTVGADGTPDAALAALERLVVPAPMSAAAIRRWRIVPDGSLGAVPWSLLAVRRGLQSASLLSPASVPVTAPEAALAARTGPRRLALFGDPVFDARDPRVVPRGAAAGAARPGMAESEPRELARLPGTARELDAIARLGGDGVVVRASGFGATRAALLQLPPGRVDVLHLATHAIMDRDLPELAALVLSRVDASGRFQPGNLRAHDILGMVGAPALVVLSACDAAAEPAGAADGRMNLVRAFLASGTRDVVASLWEASDAGATELMARCYEGLLGQGLEPEVALARAQAQLAASGRFRAPFYWAGFIVTRAAP
jgi:CHAT domain-containing protein